MVMIGINTLWGSHNQQSTPLLIVGLVFGVVTLIVGFAMLMFSTKHWLQYIHDYVDYRLAQQGTSTPPAA